MDMNLILSNKCAGVSPIRTPEHGYYIIFSAICHVKIKKKAPDPG